MFLGLVILLVIHLFPFATIGRVTVIIPIIKVSIQESKLVDCEKEKSPPKASPMS